MNGRPDLVDVPTRRTASLALLLRLRSAGVDEPPPLVHCHRRDAEAWPAWAASIRDKSGECCRRLLRARIDPERRSGPEALGPGPRHRRSGNRTRRPAPLLAPTAGAPQLSSRFAVAFGSYSTAPPASVSGHRVEPCMLSLAQATRALGFVLPPIGRRLPGRHDSALASPRGLPEAQTVEVDGHSPVILRPRRLTFRQHLESAVALAPMVHHKPHLSLSRSESLPGAANHTVTTRAVDRSGSLCPPLLRRSSVCAPGIEGEGPGIAQHPRRRRERSASSDRDRRTQGPALSRPRGRVSVRDCLSSRHQKATRTMCRPGEEP